MSFELSKVVEQLGEEAIAECGKPVGLNKEQSVRVARALAAKAGLGREEAIRQAAADTGLDEEVVAAMTRRLAEKGGEKLMDATGVSAAIDTAKESARAALTDAGSGVAKSAGGMLGRLFGRK